MSKIKKIWGLISIGFLSISAVLGIMIRERESEITPVKTVGQEKYDTASSAAKSGIGIEESKYICVEDLLEIDENTLSFANYENSEIVECMWVGCGGIF